jgi:hypothetical protein
MFQAIQQHTRAPHGYSAIDDVTKSSPELLDEMESFWLAETLKYFYLLFEEENVVSLDEYVLNTEAHPLRRPDASEKILEAEIWKKWVGKKTVDKGKSESKSKTGDKEEEDDDEEPRRKEPLGQKKVSKVDSVKETGGEEES